MITGTVTSPASGTFVCAEAEWEKADDEFNHYREVFVYEGTNSGTSVNPTDWDNSTHTLTFLPASTFDVTDKVELHERYSVAEYNEMINLAIEMVAKEALIHKVDTSTVLVEDTYKYELSNQFMWVTSVELESSTAGV